jgi:hypothetical protein
VARLSRNVRVAAGWDISKVKYAADRYDAIIIDYLQRMPGPFGADPKAGIDSNISQLSDLGRDKGKVVLVITSMPRAAYGGLENITLKTISKESGNAEYVAQSATGLINGAANGLVLAKIVKNTRGTVGNFMMRTDLGHLLFHELDPTELT